MADILNFEELSKKDRIREGVQKRYTVTRTDEEAGAPTIRLIRRKEDITPENLNGVDQAVVALGYREPVVNSGGTTDVTDDDLRQYVEAGVDIGTLEDIGYIAKWQSLEAKAKPNDLDPAGYFQLERCIYDPATRKLEGEVRSFYLANTGEEVVVFYRDGGDKVA